MQIDLGKNAFKKFTKSALVEMLEDAIATELEREKPEHKRGVDEKKKKSSASEEADEERDDLADLHEEQHGSPDPIELDDEDMSDEAMHKIESAADSKSKSKKPAKKK